MGDNRLNTYYEDHNEDCRLFSNRSRQIEFLTTNWILERYIKPDSTILDIGAGAGCYSFHYAGFGHKVVARDIVPYNIEQLRANPMCNELSINAGVADARDLSEFGDSIFDVVLCLGPLYHIGDSQGRRQCISECLRVLKNDGILSIAYISKFFVYSHMVRRNRDYLSDRLREQILNNAVALAEDPDNLWFFDSPQEIEVLMADFQVQRLTIAGTDGIAITIADTINDFNDYEFSQWLKYHYLTCEDPSIIGCSNHGLYVCRK